jgi:hypothetical protein
MTCCVQTKCRVSQTHSRSPCKRTPAAQAVAGATALLLDTPPLTQEQLELLQLLDAGANHVVLIVEGARS